MRSIEDAARALIAQERTKSLTPSACRNMAAYASSDSDARVWAAAARILEREEREVSHEPK